MTIKIFVVTAIKGIERLKMLYANLLAPLAAGGAIRPL